jgi:hypothetical protein
MNLRIEFHAEATESLDDVLDDAAVQIEDILNGDQSLQGTCLGSSLLQTSMEIAGDSSTPIGVLTLNYSVRYIR